MIFKKLITFTNDIHLIVIRIISLLQNPKFFIKNNKQIKLRIYEIKKLQGIYLPLISQLDIWKIQYDLEDFVFHFVNPKSFNYVNDMLNEKYIKRQKFTTDLIIYLKLQLNIAGIIAKVSGRPKHIYSIWHKMCNKKLNFSELHDLYAFRIVVKNIRDCYVVLNLVHHIWKPITEEFDDYIISPKLNGYKSLHTVVVNNNGRIFEIQIRTKEMHYFAEYGLAAHWRYKENYL